MRNDRSHHSCGYASVRRARALQDVLLPEIDRSLYDIETRLDELEQEDAIWMRQGVGVGVGVE